MAAPTKDNSVELITQRGRIIGRWEGGASTRDIADDVGVSQRTVERWISRWQEEGSLANKPRRGRPRVTTPQQDEQIVAASRNNSKKTAVSITHDLQIQCSAETTRRRLRENSINCHVPACKEVLNDNHRETRLGFALQYLGEDVNFWNHVIFSDESYFTSVEVKARHCWRQKGTRGMMLKTSKREP
ncbi:hypothetical protein Pcinc_015155 [Petrolisthes cinctipes]|uniref:Transposase Tc1-like domain-containing protein n=1 Tax=Petrolisthes cinctipes TaxID=88211 RepID=A0AAE1KQ33_PETCI|nr:hypothetical protein Pcinc_015155 [Petrolisthes cinctipes]